MENQIPEVEHVSKEEANALRSKYHQMFMDKLREENIEFSDRFEAMNIAFELIKSPANHSIAWAARRRSPESEVEDR